MRSTPPASRPLQPGKRAKKYNESTFIKHGAPYEIQREVDAINFIRRNTSIPVPTVIESHIQKEGSWFTMSLIPGSSLDDTWARMTEEAQATTGRELTNYLKELRSIRPPVPKHIASCTGGPAHDHRVNNGFPCGPFASVSEFHNYLVAPVALCPRPELAVSYRQQMADDHDVVFTHADLGGDHIFVEPSTGKITGIIDWEMAGWWPAYWEYVKALHGERRMQWWPVLVGKTLRSYPSELQLEQVLQLF